MSVTGNLNQIFDFGSSPMMIDLDGFYTRFSNRIVPDYDVHPNQIVYDNLSGVAVTRGVAVSLNQNFSSFPLLYTLGVTVQDVYTEESGVRRPLEYSAKYKGVAEVSYTFASPLGGGLTLGLHGKLGRSHGTAGVPGSFRRVRRRLARTPCTTFRRPWTSGTAADSSTRRSRNLFDFTQGSPLIDPGQSLR